MLFIGENIHIISKKVKQALINRDENFILNLINEQSALDCVDLNVGPAKAELEGVLPWLCQLVENNSDLAISFDTRNTGELRKGIGVCKNLQNAFINSTSADSDRLDVLAPLAKEYDMNLISLTMNRTLGIPKTADERLDLALESFDKCTDLEIPNNKIYYDPLILPVCVEQSQAGEAISTIQMIKQSFDPPVKTIIGLSNISNGSPNEIRTLINRVFAVLAHGAGLDAVIMDSFDHELLRILKMLDSKKPQNKIDKLYLDLALMVENFTDINEITYNQNDDSESDVVKCAKILLNKEIYSHSFSSLY